MLKFMCYLLIGFGFYAYKCSSIDLMIEMDRILWFEGTVVVRDSPKVIDRVAKIASEICWSIEVDDTEPESNRKEKLLVTP